MKKYAFIGGYDKTELILFLAKIATLSEKKVLVIDATVPQKARYIVPVMSSGPKYITTFEGIDVAVGFKSLDEIMEYSHEKTLQYDMILLDIDSKRAYANFRVESTDEHCFVTGFDLYSLRKGIGILTGILAPIKVTKIYFTKDMLPEEDEYVEMLSQNLKIKWDSDIVFFPFERGDRNVLNINQRFGKIKIRGLSKDYIEAVMFVAEKNLGLNEASIRKAMKIMEKA